MTRVCVVGASGKLGRVICDAVERADDLTLVARVAPSLDSAGYGAFGSVDGALAGAAFDVAVDVTRPDVVEGNVRAAIVAGLPVVIGTTGLADQQLASLDQLARDAGISLFYAPNFAIGAVLMMRFAAELARHMPSVEIVEEHAETKVDRPSGTARHTADVIAATGAARPPIHSIRLPGVVANQSVIAGSLGQSLEVRHVTTSREAFVPGVLLALRRITELPAGLTVGLDALL